MDDVHVSVAVPALSASVRFGRRRAAVWIRVLVEAVLVKRTFSLSLLEVLARLSTVMKREVWTMFFAAIGNFTDFLFAAGQNFERFVKMTLTLSSLCSH